MADTTDNKKILIDIKSNYQQYVDDLKKAREELDKLKIAQVKLTEEQKQDADFMEKFNAQYRNAQTEVRNATKVVDQATLANKAQKGSYEELYRTWQVAQTQLKLLGGTYTTNAQGVRVLSERYIEQKQVVENAKRSLDAFGKGIADNRLNVGNYSEAIQGAIGDMQSLPGPLGAAAGGVQRLSAAFKLFLANPIMLALTAIVGAIALLVKAFKNSQPLMDAFHKVSAAIGATFKVLLDRMSNFVEFLGSIFNKELRDSRKEAKALNDELIGIEETMSRKEKRELRRANKKGLFEEIREEAKGAYELTKAYQALEDAEIAFTQRKAELKREIEELINSSKDENLTNTEKLKNLDLAIVKTKELTDKETTFAKERARISQERTDQGNSTREELKANEELQAAATEIERTGLKEQKRILSERFSLLNKLTLAEKQAFKERADAAKKSVADAEKAMEESKKQLTKEIEDYKKYITDKQKADEEAAQTKRDKQLEQDEWNLSRELANQENILAIREANLENQFSIERERLEMQHQEEVRQAEQTGADVNLINEKYKQLNVLIAEAEQDAKLAVASEFAGNIATIFGKGSAIGKAAGVAQVTIETYRAAMAAYAGMIEAFPGPWGIAAGVVAAAAAVATGIANVKKILAVKIPGGGGEGGSVPSATAISSSLPAQRAYASPVGSTFLNQPQLSQAQLNAVPNQNLLTAEQIATAMSKMPPPIVTVEDINAKVAAGKKIEVRATI